MKQRNEEAAATSTSTEDHKISYTEFIAATLDFEKHLTVLQVRLSTP